MPHQVYLVELQLDVAMTILDQLRPGSPVFAGLAPCLKAVLDRSVEHSFVCVGPKRKYLHRLVRSASNLLPHSLAQGSDL